MENATVPNRQNFVMQGNEACARGALHAGCRFFAGYPITPSTEIIEYFAEEMSSQGGVFIQMEDEIASACAIIGARRGGKMSMTATSGPGFSLMQEAIGFAAETETPIVIVDVQRGGPSTGQPTLSSQQDVFQARYGSHGDYAIIALAPSSVQEMFDFTVRAFRLSEQYRTPVVILADEIIGHMRENVTILPPGFAADVGVLHPDEISSPCGDFFTGAKALVEGQFHDRTGARVGHLPVESGAFIRAINAKIDSHAYEIADEDAFFTEDAEIAIVAYGSVARPALNAVQLARGVKTERTRAAKGSGVKHFFEHVFHMGTRSKLSEDYSRLKVGLVKINTLWPFPEDALRELTQHADIIVVPEMNVGRYVREVERALAPLGKRVVSMSKCGGEIHTPDEILAKILDTVKPDEAAIRG